MSTTPMPRKTKYKSPPPAAVPEVRFKRYDEIVVRDDEFEDDMEASDEWNAYAEHFPELEDLNNLEDFLEDFETADDDKYREPS